VLSDLQDEQWCKIISWLINLDAVDRVWQWVSSDVNEKRKFLEGAQTTQVDIAALQQRLSEQQARLQAAQALLQQQEERVRQFAAQLQTARTQLDKESARRDQHNQLLTDMAGNRSRQQELARQQQQIEKDQKEITAEQPRLEALRPAREEHEKLRQERETLQTQQQQRIRLEGKQQVAQSLLEGIKTRRDEAGEWQQQLEELKKLSEREKDLEAKFQSAQAEVLQWRAEEKRLSNTLASIEARGKEAKAKLGEVQKLGMQSPCPVCTRPLAEHFPNVVKHFEDDLAKLRNEYAQTSEARKSAEAALRQARPPRNRFAARR
jgi:exonuclease SbcC